MTIFNFLSLIGGLALFLFGMNVMGSGLEKMGGGGHSTIAGAQLNCGMDQAREILTGAINEYLKEIT